MFVFVKTKDDPKIVGEIVCKANYFKGEHPEDQMVWTIRDVQGTWTIIDENDSWLAPVYRVGETVVLAEVEDLIAPNFVEPLLEKYGFDNVKWLVVPEQSFVLKEEGT